MNKTESIKKHVAESKIDSALEELLTIVKDKEQENELIMLKVRYRDIARRERLGLADYSSVAREKNQIVLALLEFLDTLSTPEEGLPVANLNQPGYKKRLALVVGCNQYEYAGELRNPLNDARSIKYKLEQLGFKVILRENPTLREFKMTVDDFGIELKNYDVGLFYFAGHGVQVNGINYLVPVEANLMAERFVEYDCLRADRVLSHMDQHGTDVNIVILDACRNNPFEKSWGRGIAGRGLAVMNAPTGTFIAYATAPGKTASDGDRENGLYTEQLLKEIETKNLTITQLFQRVRKSVISQSNNQQVPWEATSLTSDFYFNP